jgi:ribose 5-phosphate isomerase B
VLAISGRFVDFDTNKQIVEAFINTQFAGGRHSQRVDKINALD